MTDGLELERVQQLFQDIVTHEKQFKTLLEKQTPNAVDVLNALHQLRAQTENVLFEDIEFAQSKTVEERLWTHVHYRVIDDYRKRIANHEKQYGTSRPVENRKLIDQYTRFLKDTTTFYRTLIQRLVSHFNIVELHPIVAQFQLPVDTPPDSPKFQSKKIKSLVFTAVQTSLIKLGDISRYRALTPRRTAKPPPTPDYGPAYGYYVLAQSLLPENGAPANQLAVLSTYSKDFLMSTYYFYRALACDEPFATAGNNLALGFRKVLRDGVGVDGVEREDVGNLIEAFLRMHAEFYNGNELFDNPGVVKMLEDVITDRAVKAKFVNRLAFINLSALYVATHRQQPNTPQLLDTILAQYTLLLYLLSTELESTPPSPDISTHITPIIRRITASLRLYSKWLVIHHSQIPLSNPFWSHYAHAATTLQRLWHDTAPPKLSYPLEEDLAAAGFAPLESPPPTEETRNKKKHKRDRARIGNRKKGFDKLLLAWGRRGGDSHVSSMRSQGADHPNVEMTLRLADLLSDALEIATIPVSPLEIVDGGSFRVRQEEVVAEGAMQQVVSTGLPIEALGRMSLDEVDSGGERSFSEPQESSEEELGMAFSPGKMVDDIVGADSNKTARPRDNDNEEIMFSGRATRKQLYPPPEKFGTDVSRPSPVVVTGIPSPMLLPPTHINTPSPIPSPISATSEHTKSQPKTVADLMLHAFGSVPKTFSPTHSPHTLSPHLQAATAVQPTDDPFSALRSSPRMALHPYDDTRRREESPVGVIGQGRGSPRRTGETTTGGNGNLGSPRWSGGFAGL